MSCSATKKAHADEMAARAKSACKSSRHGVDCQVATRDYYRAEAEANRSGCMISRSSLSGLGGVKRKRRASKKARRCSCARRGRR